MKTKTDSGTLTLIADDARMSPNGAPTGIARGMLLSVILAGGISSGSVLARTVVIEVAPPAAQVEVIPVQRTGYTWAPGYWGWQHDKHVWVKGHTMRARNGYEWTPDRWTQVANHHQFEAGHWTRSERHGQ